MFSTAFIVQTIGIIATAGATFCLGFYLGDKRATKHTETRWSEAVARAAADREA